MGVVTRAIGAWHDGRLTEDQLVDVLSRFQPVAEAEPTGTSGGDLEAAVDDLGWLLPAEDSWREVVQMVDRGLLPLSVYDRVSQRLEAEA